MQDNSLAQLITLRQSVPADAPAVADFCQPIYAAIYPNAKYGIKPEHFSLDVFRTRDTLEYITHNIANNAHQAAFVAESEDRIVGTISIERHAGDYALRTFYVEPSLQGQGIGRRLMERVLEFCTEDLPVHVEVAQTNTKAIAMYERWGFCPAPELGLSLRHWPEWPDGLQNGYVFLRANRADLRV